MGVQWGEGYRYRLNYLFLCYVTFTTHLEARCAGARCHDLVAAIGFAHPPSSPPRDPSSILRPRNRPNPFRLCNLRAVIAQAGDATP